MGLLLACFAAIASRYILLKRAAINAILRLNSSYNLDVRTQNDYTTDWNGKKNVNNKTGYWTRSIFYDMYSNKRNRAWYDGDVMFYELGLNKCRSSSTCRH